MVETPIDWNEWRANYGSMTFADQQAFYGLVAELHPCQQSWDETKAREFMRRYRPNTVIELGGWDGALANAVGAGCESWKNYDLVEVPQACSHPGYSIEVLEQPLWDRTERVRSDAFIASHTIEHICGSELEQLISKLDVFCCLIEAPLSQEATDWTDYQGSHILEVGWRTINGWFADNGYVVADTWDTGRVYTA